MYKTVVKHLIRGCALLLMAISLVGHAESSSESVKKSVVSGTSILVKLSETVGTHNKKAGDRFRATLEGNLVSEGVILAPDGSEVYGRVLVSNRGRLAKGGELQLTITDIKIDGTITPIHTSILGGEGPKSGVARKAIKGATVGALANGSKGAERGAKAGVGLGVLEGGKHTGIMSGELVEFFLTSDFQP